MKFEYKNACFAFKWKMSFWICTRLILHLKLTHFIYKLLQTGSVFFCFEAYCVLSFIRCTILFTDEMLLGMVKVKECEKKNTFAYVYLIFMSFYYCVQFAMHSLCLFSSFFLFKIVLKTLENKGNVYILDYWCF